MTCAQARVAWVAALLALDSEEERGREVRQMLLDAMDVVGQTPLEVAVIVAVDSLNAELKTDPSTTPRGP